MRQTSEQATGLRRIASQGRDDIAGTKLFAHLDAKATSVDWCRRQKNSQLREMMPMLPAFFRLRFWS
ncbi:hypothetical protein D6T65_15200 [Arthrobacter frigidicola]|nr:hypothetical protein D6T65_15200 [Arthrobacter frigidicola]